MQFVKQAVQSLVDEQQSENCLVYISKKLLKPKLASIIYYNQARCQTQLNLSVKCHTLFPLCK